MIVPAAIDFQAQHDWLAVRQRCHDLASRTRAEINAVTGMDPICPDSLDWYVPMFAARLPEVEVELLQRRLYQRHRIEVPMHRWNGQSLIRPSFQAYNTQAAARALVEAMADLLPAMGRELRGRVLTIRLMVP